MSLSQPLIAELSQEAETTRRVLERVPEDRLSWKPHPKSMSLGQLALHIAGLPGGLADLLSESEREVPTVPLPEAGSGAEILATLEESVGKAEAKLEEWTDADLAADWRMTRDGETVLTLPRIGMVRAIMLNHWYHHRGQLLVYLRLLDVPVPVVYGPTADEGPPF
jgi:uncharacterized damage-inducible protein DinB